MAVFVWVWAWLAQQVDNLAGFRFLFSLFRCCFPNLPTFFSLANEFLSVTREGVEKRLRKRLSSLQFWFFSQCFGDKAATTTVFPLILWATSYDTLPLLLLLLHLRSFFYLFLRLWHSFYSYKSSASHVQSSLPFADYSVYAASRLYSNVRRLLTGATCCQAQVLLN